jgi:hypothetical protein
MNLNIWNKSEKAKEIANGQMKQLLESMGLGPIKDTMEMHGRPVMVNVSIKEDRNEIKGFKPASNAPSQPETAQTKTAPPWAR